MPLKKSKQSAGKAVEKDRDGHQDGGLPLRGRVTRANGKVEDEEKVEEPDENGDVDDEEREDEYEEEDEDEEDGKDDDDDDDEVDDGEDDENTKPSKKRKAPPTTTKKPTKAAKTSRSTASKVQSKASPSTKQLMNFLLSSSSLPHCFPPEELSFAKSNPSSRSYSLTSPSEFTPWEHLLCAHLLSKPLSHALGMRSIRTLLNKPYVFRTPEAVVKAGEKKVWEGLEEARTQHRQKTAAYVAEMAKGFVGEGGKDWWFELSVKANEEGSSGVVNFIKENVKGMGETGGEVFCRRIQCVDGWGDAVWPFVDSKAMDALRTVGIEVKDADELQGLIEKEVDWGMVKDMGLNERNLAKGELAGEEMDVQVQSEFVVLVERALGCVLQGKVEEMRAQAAEL